MHLRPVLTGLGPMATGTSDQEEGYQAASVWLLLELKRGFGKGRKTAREAAMNCPSA